HAGGSTRRGPRARARRLPRPCDRPGRDARGACVPRLRARPEYQSPRGQVVSAAGAGEGEPDLSPVSSLIVRWSLGELPAVLGEVGVERPFLVASQRWSPDVEVVGRWSEIPSHRIEVPASADSLLAFGGGSAIDTAKH